MLDAQAAPEVQKKWGERRPDIWSKKIPMESRHHGLGVAKLFIRNKLDPGQLLLFLHPLLSPFQLSHPQGTW